jgi:uncharacterized protein (DUF1697 family)
MTPCIALLRGINVGRAKRIAMADLRGLVEALGFSQVRTLLNSGNVLFEAARPNAAKVARSIEQAIEARFGFRVAVVVITAADLDTIIKENPLSQATADASRFLVAFVASPATLGKAKALLAQAWAPDELALGSRAAYLSCVNGLIESKLAQAFARVAADGATTRNWSTVLKLQALVEKDTV